MKPEKFLSGRVSLFCGDCVQVLKTMPENYFDSCVTDPPYHLTSIVERFGAEDAAPAKVGATGAYERASRGFMNQTWDGGDVAFKVETWREVYRVLKPGAYLLAFSSNRTYHRMACAIEDAGFEIRDMLDWLFGSGFPKSLNIAREIEKTLCERRKVGDRVKWFYRDGGEEMCRVPPFRHPSANEQVGRGTALKPGKEPIVLARKPLEGTVAENVLKWGTGGLDIDGCRVAHDEECKPMAAQAGGDKVFGQSGRKFETTDLKPGGRWPANVVHDGSDEVVALFPDSDGQSGAVSGKEPSGAIWGAAKGERPTAVPRGDEGSSARFFYGAKADANDRIGSNHPTVKPVDLMQYFARLVTPAKRKIIDPFAGTGTTGEAAFYENFDAVLIEREPSYQEDIRRRMKLATAGPEERSRESIKAKLKDKPIDAGPLFGGLDAGSNR